MSLRRKSKRKNVKETVTRHETRLLCAPKTSLTVDLASEKGKLYDLQKYTDLYQETIFGTG